MIPSGSKHQELQVEKFLKYIWQFLEKLEKLSFVPRDIQQE